jgi:hypothetical protein
MHNNKVCDVAKPQTISRTGQELDQVHAMVYPLLETQHSAYTVQNKSVGSSRMNQPLHNACFTCAVSAGSCSNTAPPILAVLNESPGKQPVSVSESRSAHS